MYKLYYKPATASLCVHWMLIELGVPFELQPVDTDAPRTAEYLRLNPTGQVPTLIADGRPVTESAAILMLLAERHPEAGFARAAGSPERAAYLELMVYLANALLPAFRNLFYVEDFAAPEWRADSIARAGGRIAAVFDRLDARLSDGRAFLLDEAIAAPDYLLTMLARWSRSMPKPASDWPDLGRYVARMKQRPGLREVHAREGLTDWIDQP
jgi:glutathione S-transferase